MRVDNWLSRRPKAGYFFILVRCIFLTLIFPLFLTSCSSQNTPTPAVSTDSGSSGLSSGASSGSEQEFTVEELAKYDGQEGRRAYIAVDGIVYDVTDVPQWDSKMHAGKFAAGKDYTEELKNAPHGAGNLDQAEKIGTLVKP